MSTTVDQRVVEMRFDNQQFERNVSTTMSTLDKLKQKLNLTGASKGLEEVNSSAKKVDMSGLSRGVETVSAKFSAMQVIGVTALANITNSAVNAGKRIISALTIDPVKTGFQEYETQINAVQTILANTSSKGTTIDDVNKALDELNKYADLTIYNFTEMTRNIGTFTAAGVDLETSVNAIQGIANLAAVSGSTSQQASTAMYQLSQALAAGTVKLMDWNSVVNAGMGGELFQNALKETSNLLGTGAEAAIKAEGSFRESLKTGWLTSEVLTETLKKFTTSGANEMVAEYTGLSKEAVEAALEEAEARYGEADAIEQASKALAEKSGKNKDEIQSTLQFAKTAEDAATKIKTFSQLWDALKESAQSGWTQTWELIIGDFEEAKSLLTPLFDFLSGIINKMSDTRNAILESALGKSFKGLVDNVQNIIKPIQKSADSVKEVIDSIKDYATIVDEIIGGKWGNGQSRWDKLTEAGYDWAHAQNLVNEKLGNAKRHATDYAEAQNDVAKAQESSTETQTELSDSTIDYIVELTELSDAQLKALGYTDDQIKSFRELAKAAEKTGIPLKDFLKNIDEINGRYLLINSFKNIGQGLVSVFKSIGTAWKQAFYGDASDEEILAKRSEALYNVIAAMHKFSLKIKSIENRSDEITRTFKGLFAIVDMLSTVLGGGFKIALKLITEILGYFHVDILDVTAAAGDAAVKFRDWFDSIFDVTKVLDNIVPEIKSVARAVREWLSGLTKISGVDKFVDKIKSVFNTFKSVDLTSVKGLKTLFESIRSAFGSLKKISFKDVGEYIFDGLIDGLGNGASKVIDTIVQCAKDLIAKFCEIVGVHSPSTVFMAIGGFIIAGLILGIKDGIIAVPDAFQGIIDKCIAIIKNVDWGTVFAIGVSIAAITFVKKVGDALEAFSAPFEGLGNILNNAAGVVEQFRKVVKSVGKVVNSVALNIKTKALKNLAIALAIIAGSVIALTYFYDRKMWGAVAIIGVLAGILAGLAFAVSKMSDSSVKINKEGASIDGIKTTLLTIAAAVAILGVTVKLIGNMDPEEAKQGFIGLVGIMVAMLGFLAACRKIVSTKSLKHIDAIGHLMMKLSIAMALMVGVAKLAGKLSPDELKKGAAFAAGFTVFIWALSKVTKNSGKNINKLGSMILKVSIAMGLMVGVIKLIDLLEPLEMIKGAAFAAAFVLFVKGLTKAATVGKDDKIAKLGGLLLSISISMVMMVGVCKLVDKLSAKEMLKGAAFAAAFTLFVKALVKVTTIGNDKQIAKVAGTILAMSLAIGILAGVSIMLSLISIEGLIKGVTAVSILAAMMSLMIHSAKDANNVKGNIIAMTVAIAIMAAAVAGLSFVNPKKLAGAVLALSILIGMFSLLVRSTKDINKAMGTLIVMTVAIGVLAGVLILMSALDVKNALTNASGLSLLLIAISGAMFILSKMNTTIKGAIKGAISLSIMAVPLLVFIKILQQMNGIETSTENVLLLVGLMAAMTVLLGVLTIIGYFGLSALAGVALLTAMWIPMMVFIDAIKEVSGIDVAKENVVILIGLMASMTGLLAVLSVIGFLAIPAVLGIAALTAMWIPMMVFIDVIKEISGIDIATGNVNLLMDMMSRLTDMLTQLAIVGPLALIGVGAMQGLILLVGELGLIATAVGYLMEKFPSLQTFIDTGLPVLEQLADGLGIMIGKFIGGIGEGLGDSLVKIGDDITEFMGSLQEASEKAKGIEGSSFDGVKQLIGVLAGVGLTSVGMSIADVWTNIIGDKSAIDKFKDDGVAFFEAFKEISNAAEGFSLPEGFSAEALKTLITAIASVGAVSIGTTLADLFLTKIGDKTAMEKFKEDGKAFFSAIKEISSEMVGFSFPEDFSVEGLTTLLNALKSVGKSMIGLSIADLFAVGEDKTAMEKFKTDGIAFFKAIKAISAEMVGFTFPEDFSTEGLTSLLNALKRVGNSMIGLSIADLFAIGEDQTAMEKFKTDGIAFFKAIKAISSEMVGFTFPKDFSVEGLTKLFDTLKSVGDYTIGASWGDIFTLGGTTIEKFKTDGVTFFSALKEMSTEANGVTIESFSKAENAISKIKAIITSVNTIDYSGVKTFTGIGTGGFGADGPMHDIAKALKDFGDIVADINTEAMDISITAAGKLKTLISSLTGLDTSGIENFKVKDIGDKLKSYSSSVSGLDSEVISSSISAANRLKNFINSLAGLNTSGVGSFKSAIESLGSIQIGNIESVFGKISSTFSKAGVNIIDSLEKGMRSKQSSLLATSTAIITVLIGNVKKLTQEFKVGGSTLMINLASGITSHSPKVLNLITTLINSMTQMLLMRSAMFMNCGAMMMINLAKGISSNLGMVSNSTTSAITSAVSSIYSHYISFYLAGGYLADGFANGISANSYKAAAQAAAMAKAAKEAAEKALGIASPSKVFYKIGSFTGQGLVNALSDYGSKVYNAGSDMADCARNGLAKAISKVYDVINGDFDTQPVIRPVIDLSEVESGASSISSMFGFGTSVGITANTGAISSMMNSNQNGGNDDVISAIEKLRGDLSNIGRPVYQINGINYNNDDVVASAFEAIIRAANIERRM